MKIQNKINVVEIKFRVSIYAHILTYFLPKGVERILIVTYLISLIVTYLILIVTYLRVLTCS